MASKEPIESTPAESTVLEISREQEGRRIISKYTGWAAGSGAIPFPFWDLAAIAAVQIKMVKDLLDLYDSPFSESRVKSIICVLVGSVSPLLLVGVTASSFIKFLPGVGLVLASVSLPLLSGASAHAVGKVMLSHLESGGSLDDFDPEAVKDKFKEHFEAGKEKVKRATSKVSPSTAS